jgi:hypothetical protein
LQEAEEKLSEEELKKTVNRILTRDVRLAGFIR